MFLWSDTQGLAGGSVRKHETVVLPYISGAGRAIGHRRSVHTDAMLLAYGPVQRWGVFTPMQCAEINRYVATFAVPVLGFNFIVTSNLYEINYKFIAADTLHKVVILLAFGVWSMIVSAKPIGGGRFRPEWSITLFSLSSLPNTLIVGIHLLEAMCGKPVGILMVQYRAAKILINERFPSSVGEITSIRVDSDVVSLSGIEPLETN
ncbi:hypothetical protein CRG98_049819, partial [Punica granatum]